MCRRQIQISWSFNAFLKNIFSSKSVGTVDSNLRFNAIFNKNEVLAILATLALASCKSPVNKAKLLSHYFALYDS